MILPIAGFLISLVSVPVLAKLASRLGMLDEPTGEALKPHEQSTPLTGGVALLFSWAIVSVAGGLAGLGWEMASIAALSLPGFVLGCVDDAIWKNRPQTYRPRVKFAAQVLVSLSGGLLFWIAGYGAALQLTPLLLVPILGLLVFGAMNAVNMQDGIDGNAGLLGVISSAGFAVSSVMLGDRAGVILALTLLAVLLGFLVFNWPKARVFMGDSGSHWLGLMLILLAVRLTHVSGSLLVLPFACGVLGIPVVDAGLAVLRRLRSNTRLFSGDRGHLYDRLMNRGWRVQRVILVYAAMHGLLVSCAVALIALLHART